MTKMNVREVAKWLTNIDGNGASDEEFAEFFVLAHKMRTTNEPDVELTKEDMEETSASEIAGHIKECLDEIIFSEEIDPSCWWKQDDILNKLDNDKVGEEMADMLMDTNITTYDMFEDLVTAYSNGDKSFRNGMDKSLEILIWRNLSDLVRHMEENALKKED